MPGADLTAKGGKPASSLRFPDFSGGCGGVSPFSTLERPEVNLYFYNAQKAGGAPHPPLGSEVVNVYGRFSAIRAAVQAWVASKPFENRGSCVGVCRSPSFGDGDWFACTRDAEIQMKASYLGFPRWWPKGTGHRVV